MFRFKIIDTFQEVKDLFNSGKEIYVKFNDLIKLTEENINAIELSLFRPYNEAIDKDYELVFLTDKTICKSNKPMKFLSGKYIFFEDWLVPGEKEYDPIDPIEDDIEFWNYIDFLEKNIKKFKGK